MTIYVATLALGSANDDPLVRYAGAAAPISSSAMTPGSTSTSAARAEAGRLGLTSGADSPRPRGPQQEEARENGQQGGMLNDGSIAKEPSLPRRGVSVRPDRSSSCVSGPSESADGASLMGAAPPGGPPRRGSEEQLSLYRHTPLDLEPRRRRLDVTWRLARWMHPRWRRDVSGIEEKA